MATPMSEYGLPVDQSTVVPTFSDGEFLTPDERIAKIERASRIRDLKDDKATLYVGGEFYGCSCEPRAITSRHCFKTHGGLMEYETAADKHGDDPNVWPERIHFVLRMTPDPMQVDGKKADCCPVAKARQMNSSQPLRGCHNLLLNDKYPNFVKIRRIFAEARVDETDGDESSVWLSVLFEDGQLRDTCYACSIKSVIMEFETAKLEAENEKRDKQEADRNAQKKALMGAMMQAPPEGKPEGEAKPSTKKSRISWGMGPSSSEDSSRRT